MFYTQSDDPTIAAATGLRSHPFQAEATGLLDEVRHAMERNQPDGARAAALQLVTLLAQTAEVGVASARGGLAPWQRRKIAGYVREDLVRPIQIDELAEQIPLSVSHFCRAFKETFGEDAARLPHPAAAGDGAGDDAGDRRAAQSDRACQWFWRPGPPFQAVPAGGRRFPRPPGAGATSPRCRSARRRRHAPPARRTRSAPGGRARAAPPRPSPICRRGRGAGRAAQAGRRRPATAAPVSRRRRRAGWPWPCQCRGQR